MTSRVAAGGLISLALLTAVPRGIASAAGPSDIGQYVRFLKKGAKDPVDYVLSQFTNHDVVILCERQHSESTQYDFFLRLVSDPRFAANVGTIFTELGARNLQPQLDKLLLDSKNISESELDRRALAIYRNLTLFPVWDNVNFYNFIRAVCRLNRQAAPERKLRIVFSDLPFSWDGMTKERYATFMTSLTNRDRMIAEYISTSIRGGSASSALRSKFLVIMNYRHAFNDFPLVTGGRKAGDVGRYLFEAFPGRVANIMLNSAAVLAGSKDNEVRLQPIHDGRWDAAFRVCGLKEAGFDFSGTPFGSDKFDFFPFTAEGVRYQDVFTGFVFYEPLAEHRLVDRLPGLVDEAFAPELRRRIAIAGENAGEADVRALMTRVPRIRRYDGLSDWEKMIARWIK